MYKFLTLNFHYAAISFAVEALIAQPVTRMVMLKMHEIKDKKSILEQ
ncbi:MULTISPECIES: hypothetical protein [Clostridium]|uniref:Uncharacterized protein n=2 Tax=Clostridium TaxID=1485 RepID=A0A151ANH7_9CLOT|nr:MULTISPECIES: hypothetical protein [Clostridium]KYH29169.1 hypothetical protein CLCOL_13060 [Clostridium colicanis DSM 13634]PRR73996.1 hypothetical protein CPAL_11210 [Clostridium thermopalmarium DSM 5974]PVZ20917.1 hypothetical protein LX19_02510 [Clostridium thermopalmarium DSM 5974]